MSDDKSRIRASLSVYNTLTIFDWIGLDSYSYYNSYFCLNGLQFPIRSEIFVVSNILAIPLPNSINSTNKSLVPFLQFLY